MQSCRVQTIVLLLKELRASLRSDVSSPPAPGPSHPPVQEPTRDFSQRADLSVTLRFNVSSLKVASNLWSDNLALREYLVTQLFYPMILAWVTSLGTLLAAMATCSSWGTQHRGDYSLHRRHWSRAQSLAPGPVTGRLGWWVYPTWGAGPRVSRLRALS